MIKNKDIISNDEVLRIIYNHITNKIPGSFIRKGDGENIVIGYKKIQKIKYKDFKHMMRIMNIRLFNFKFQKIVRKKLQEAFQNCDVMGISKENQRYGLWAIEDEVIKLLNFKSKNFCDMNFHMEFIKYPNLNKLENTLANEIISNRNIGIISCHNVSQFLERHNTKVKKWIKMPKQRDKLFHKKINLNFYNEVFSQIKSNDVDFWIVAAGIHAKIFCNYIKIKNGLAIDIGSSIDTWKNLYSSRGHLKKIYNSHISN